MTPADTTGASGDRPPADPETRVDVAAFAAATPGTETHELETFADRALQDAVAELRDVSDIRWHCHGEEPIHLGDASARRPSDFLDEATLRMAEGPYDLVVVVTDAPLLSRRHEFVAGLPSRVGRVAVVSTRRLTRSPRGEPLRPLDATAVRWNAATLTCHLIGHVLGASHDAGGRESVMSPFAFDPERRAVPPFDADVCRHLERIARDVPDDEATPRRAPGRLAFHLQSALRNPGVVADPLIRNRAPLLALSLPRLATAAVAPTLVLVFSAETWDVGIHLTDGVAAGFALVSVLAASLYLTAVQDLYFPREPRRVLTEHMALVNVAAVLTMLGATIGLFVMVGVLMLVVQFLVFPSDLITNWPTLENPQVNNLDLVRTAGFISTVGVLTGALAGGLESRTAIRHLALFRDRP